MTDPHALQTFIRDGLSRYAQARDTIEYFESRMHEVLRQTFDERTTWKNFRRARDTNGDLLPPITGRSGAQTRWLWAYVEGEKRGDEKTFLTLGLCWNPPKVPNPVVLYSAFTTGAGKLVNLTDRPDRDPRVRLGSIDRNERRAFLVPTADFDAASDLAVLLEATDAGIPPAPPPVS